jgi:phosphoribosylamine--glycine ligase
MDFEGLASLVQKQEIDLTVVGPEAPLVAGIVDEFEKKGLRIFGPGKAAARLEGSKVFCKELLWKYDIPTGRGEVFGEKQDALDFVKGCDFPCVVKADGLAAGKGVIICRYREEACEAIENIMGKRIFGDAGKKVIIEEFLEGEEASCLAFTDGEEVVPLLSAQDHKAIFDGDKGPNTGGMGAYSPAPVVTAEIEAEVMREIIRPVIRAMAEEGTKYRGVLYAGLMITDKGPKVLEFNVRFGDPETQAIIPLLKTDLILPLSACIDGTLGEISLEWNERTALCVVLASRGYPGKYERGKEIRGLEELSPKKEVYVFHAGTVRKDGSLITNGGRVLGVTGVGSSIREAIDTTYRAVGEIQFDGVYYRKDIGFRALNRKQ